MIGRVRYRRTLSPMFFGGNPKHYGPMLTVCTSEQRAVFIASSPYARLVLTGPSGGRHSLPVNPVGRKVWGTFAAASYNIGVLKSYGPIVALGERVLNFAHHVSDVRMSKNPPMGKKMKKKETKEERERKILSYQSALKEKARLGMWRSRALKRRATIPEKTLLEALRTQGYWLKFQPYFYTDQHLYIPDFRLATTRYKLLVEVDGPSHQHRQTYDEARTAWLKQHRNCVVIRFTNEQVMTQIERVLEAIAQHDPLRIGDQRTTLSKSKLNELRRAQDYAQDCDPETQFMKYMQS